MLIIRKKADVVIGIMHSGTSCGSSYGDQIPYPENFATTVAEQVPGTDAIIPGPRTRRSTSAS